MKIKTLLLLYFLQFDEVFTDPISEDPATTKAEVVEEEEEDPIIYATPKPPPGAYIAETFDDIVSFDKTWVRSQTKKDGVDADLAKYDGECNASDCCLVCFIDDY